MEKHYNSIPLHDKDEEAGNPSFADELDSLPLQRAEMDSENPSPSQRRRQSRTACLFPASIVVNIILFLGVLFVLARPCYFSDRACRYDAESSPRIYSETLDRVNVGYAGEGIHGAAGAEAEDARASSDLSAPATADASSSPLSAASLELLGDVNGIVPQFDTEEIVFMNDSRYANEHMFESEGEYNKILAQWHEDMPQGRGFVSVDNSSAYPSLQRPWQTPFGSGDGYSIASLHQLHCLYMILSYTGDLAFGNIGPTGASEKHAAKQHDTKHGKHKGHGNHKNKGFEDASGMDLIDRADEQLEAFRQSLEDDVPEAEDEDEQDFESLVSSSPPTDHRRDGRHHAHNPEDRARHVTHCFDYLRQSARCAGDATLEGKSSSLNDMTDGWGDTHICKVDRQVKQWVVDNRYSDKMGID